MSVRVLHGDMLLILPTLEANSVHSVVCDPPYHLQSMVDRFGAKNAAPAAPGVFGRSASGFMGQTWDGGDIASRPDTWERVYRVMKPGAFLLAFGGTRTAHRMACAIEDAGFEIKDTLAWLYGSGFPKSHNPGDKMDRDMWDETEWERGERSHRSAFWGQFGTALKPAYEPIILARKPSPISVALTVLRNGCGAINIDACRISWEGPSPQIGTPGWGGPNKTLSAVPGTGGAIVERSAPSDLGRYPANVVHDGSDEVLAAFPIAPGQRAAVRRDSGSGRKADAIFNSFEHNSESTPRGDSGSAARFFKACPFNDEELAVARFHYSGKANKADRAGSKHPTVKPLALMSWLVKMVTPPGGTVLDPFAGSGTTLLAADRLQFNAIGIEQDAAYVADIHRRLNADGGLFADILP